MYKKALHSHAQARQQEETPWQENRQAGNARRHIQRPSWEALTRRARTALRAVAQFLTGGENVP